MTLVAVCVATYLRNDGLAALLRSLDAVEVPDDVELRIEVADNDPDGGAVAGAAMLAATTRWPVAVTHEPTPGVSAPRNATVRAALASGADLLAFVDDDEAVDPGWLTAHLDARGASGAPVTTGPVTPTYDPGIADWWPATRLHGPEIKPAGTELPICWTGNTVVERAVFEDVEPWFDDEFRWGGEDSEFFTRVGMRGHRIVWVPDAEASERVPAHRATLRWVGRRYLWAGRVKGVLERRHEGRRSTRTLRRMVVGCWYVMRGLARAPRLIVAPGPTSAMIVRDLAFGAGQVSGAVAGGPRGGVQRG